MSAKEPNKKVIITLECSDGEIFDVDEAFVVQSPAIKFFLINEPPIRIPFSCKIFRKVLEYYDKHYVKAPKRYEDLKTWDLEFVKVDKDTLYDLIQEEGQYKSLMDSPPTERLDLGNLNMFLKATGLLCPRETAENLEDMIIEQMSRRRPEDEVLDQIPSEDAYSRPSDDLQFKKLCLGLNMDE